MSITDRFKQITGVERRETQAALRPDLYYSTKSLVHTRLVDQLDPEALRKLEPDVQRRQLAKAIADLVADENLPLSREERAALVDDLLDDVAGLGPLEPLLRDPTISDILVNTANLVFVERFGKMERTNLRFRDNEHLLQIINRIVNRVGRRVDENSPMVDARLPDGSRVNAIIPPLAVDGPLLSIRRFGVRPLLVQDLLAHHSITEAMVTFLRAAVTARLNILISGGTGSGKTTMLNVLSAFIPESERIITIEDAAELQLQQTHVGRLETRPPNVEGKGEVVARDLVRNALRMRPDRIIVGEVRSVEILDMLQAMNTGHDGSMATVHANSPRDALARINAMIGMTGVTLSEDTTTQMVHRALDLIVQLSRGTDGRRRVVSIAEVTGAEGNRIQLQEIFAYRQTGVDRDGRVLGRFVASGVRPLVLERMERSGQSVPASLFTAGELS